MIENKFKARIGLVENCLHCFFRQKIGGLTIFDAAPLSCLQSWPTEGALPFVAFREKFCLSTVGETHRHHPKGYRRKTLGQASLEKAIYPLRKMSAGGILHKWPEERVLKYVGTVKKSLFSYALETDIRDNGASGGSVTAILASLLESAKIDGALVCRSAIVNGRVETEFFIAKTRADLISAQGSKYTAVNFNKDAMPLIRAFEGKLAVVALPCDAGLVHRLKEKDARLREKIVLLIALFCGHNSERELTDKITSKLSSGHGKLIDWRYRFGHWRGRLRVSFSDGSSVEKPFSYFSLYQNLYFFCQTKCHYCFDHTGYFSDISAGDIWSLRMRREPIKHTALVVRTEPGLSAVEHAVSTGRLSVREEPISEVCQGQARTMPFHYNVSARRRAGAFLGIDIPDRVKEPFDWRHDLVALFVLLNERISKTCWGSRLIFLIPRPILRLYLYFLKALESI